MADKRATPEAPQDADTDPRGQKRAAPTIDLTATEVPARSAAAAPPPDADEPSPPEPPAASKTADHTKPAWSANIGGIVLAASAGAACMVLVLFGLWLGGVLPVARHEFGRRQRARRRCCKNRSAPLRITRCRARSTRSRAVAKLPPGDTGVADKLAAADNAMKSLGVALAALSHRTDDAAANAAGARKAADAAEKAVADLQTAMKDRGGERRQEPCRAPISRRWKARRRAGRRRPKRRAKPSPGTAATTMPRGSR